MDENKIRKLYARNEVQQVFTNLQSSSSVLSDEEAAKRLKKYGTNTIKKAAAESECFKNFFSMMAILLWISGLIAIVSGTLELGIAI